MTIKGEADVKKIKIMLILFAVFNETVYLCIAFNPSGCSSARLEYASGGRVVASSNLVTPTKQKP